VRFGGYASDASIPLRRKLIDHADAAAYAIRFICHQRIRLRTDKMNGSQPARRILLAVTGLTPQVVTETLYALACGDGEKWVPDEIHLITTATGAESARLNLLLPNGWFHRLCKDYALPAIDFPVGNIHVLHGHDELRLEDIRTQEQNTVAADFIMETVRRLTEDAGTELHVSIAGGRKTMGYYLGYALSLYGRPQDRLSHVLVSDPYETNREFYYPTPYDHPIHSPKGGKEVTVDARNAKVELAAIPFVRLRDGLPARLLNGHADFSRVVETANRGLDAPHLVLDIARREAWADGELMALSPTEFLVLLWLAERAANGEAVTDWSSAAMADAYLRTAARVFNSMSADYERIEEAIKWRIDVAIKLAKYFEPHKSRVNSAFADVLGKKAAERYTIKRSSENDTAVYFLPLQPEQVEIRSE
jgi:CRISPR-associated protein (TIGR02584 family)